MDQYYNVESPRTNLPFGWVETPSIALVILGMGYEMWVCTLEVLTITIRDTSRYSVIDTVKIGWLMNIMVSSFFMIDDM